MEPSPHERTTETQRDVEPCAEPELSRGTRRPQKCDRTLIAVRPCGKRRHKCLDADQWGQRSAPNRSSAVSPDIWLRRLVFDEKTP